jgi:hypothetical protein
MADGFADRAAFVAGARDYYETAEPVKWGGKFWTPVRTAAGASIIVERELAFTLLDPPKDLRSHIAAEAVGRTFLWDACGKNKIPLDGYEDARIRLHDRPLTDFRYDGGEDHRKPVIIMGGREVPLRQAVEEAMRPKVQIAVPEQLPQVQPKAKQPLPPKPSKAQQIRAAMSSPILGLGTTPAARNFLAPPATPPKDDWWWEQRQERDRKAQAAAQKRQMEREQKEALQRAKNAPSKPQVAPKPTEAPSTPDKTTPAIRRKL